MLARARRLQRMAKNNCAQPLVPTQGRQRSHLLRRSLRRLSTLNSHLSSPILLSYSYTALEPFRYAKAHGWKTLLVQIDPGPEEERIVAEEAARVPELAGDWQAAPPEYWASWREECKLADRIVVNSEWSREGLIRGGVPGEKISVIPLAYEPDVGSARTHESHGHSGSIRRVSRRNGRCACCFLV